MKRYEFMHIWFPSLHGGEDVTPTAEAVVAKLNVLGAQGWHPSFWGRGILQREIPAKATES